MCVCVCMFVWAGMASGNLKSSLKMTKTKNRHDKWMKQKMKITAWCRKRKDVEEWKERWVVGVQFKSQAAWIYGLVNLKMVANKAVSCNL